MGSGDVQIARRGSMCPAEQLLLKHRTALTSPRVFLFYRHGIEEPLSSTVPDRARYTAELWPTAGSKHLQILPTKML